MTKLRQQLRQFLAQPATAWTINTAQRVHGVVLPPGATTNLQIVEAIIGPTVEVNEDE